MESRHIDNSAWLNSKLKSQIEKEFLIELSKALKDKEAICAAVLERESVKLNDQAVDLSAIDTINAFNHLGELQKQKNVFVDQSRVSAFAFQTYGLKMNVNFLSVREQIILEAALFKAQGKINDIYQPLIKDLYNLHSDLIMKINSSEFSASQKEALNQQSNHLMEQVKMIINVQTQSVISVCSELDHFGLVTPLAYDIKPAFNELLKNLLAENHWKALLNQAQAVREAYRVLEVSRVLSSQAYTKTSMALGLLTQTLDMDASKSNDEKIAYLSPALKEFFCDRSNETKIFGGRVYKDYADFVQYLNKHQSKDHFVRMVGLMLKGIYADSTVTSDADTALKIALNQLQIPEEKKYYEVYKSLLPIEVCISKENLLIITSRSEQPVIDDPSRKSLK